LEIATSLYQEGIKLCEQTESIQLILQAYIGLAFTKQAQGDAEAANMMLGQALQIARKQSFSRVSAQQVEAYQAWLSLVQGDNATALGWAYHSNLNDQQELNHVHEREYLILTRVLIRQSKIDEAMQWLEKLAQLAQVQGRRGSEIEILTLQAEALQVSGDISRAIEYLAQALALAEPEGYIRVFVDEGTYIERLLVLMYKDNRHNHNDLAKYIKQLLSVSGNTSAEEVASVLPLLDQPLTDRELEILRLIVAGYSNKEIAGRLVLAISTVKWYINIIYGKLQVESRTKAIVRARELNIL
jgi:LuxR family maltose regulon positive regulatory protein